MYPSKTVFFGATLCALEKKGGGIRPIAVGNVFRRLAAKVLSKSLQEKMGTTLRPIQLGYGTKSGCEAAIHSMREYIESNYNSIKVILKGDFLNAFNLISRGAILSRIQDEAIQAYPYAHQAYSSPTLLFYGEHTLSSAQGVQQGDPLGPLAFALAVHPLACSMASEVNIWFLDDVTLSGSPEVVLSDLMKIINEAKKIGLQLNPSKCELTVLNCTLEEKNSIHQNFEAVAPGVRLVENSDLTLLGSPLSMDGIPAHLTLKIDSLKRLK